MNLVRDKCFEIMSLLKDNMRFWGHHIDSFVEAYLSLNAAGRAELSKGFESELKYDFLCQALAHALREYDSATEKDRRKYLDWCFVLLVFENFDFDYRENTLRLTALFEYIKNDRKLLSQSWSKVEGLATQQVKRYLGAIKNSPTSPS